MPRATRRLKELYLRYGGPPFDVADDEHLPLGFDFSDWPEAVN